MKGQRTDGLTVIEVLVAMVLLAVISTAVVGSFSLMNRINQAASADVDYSRVVRSIYERTKLDWQLPLEWKNERVGGMSIAEYALSASDGRCRAVVIDDPVVPAAVRVVSVSCEAQGELSAQTYNLEFGQP